ncbi:MAG: hypothetical protein ACKOGA_13490 [Planctomycetaceae bacterium]
MLATPQRGVICHPQARNTVHPAGTVGLRPRNQPVAAASTDRGQQCVRSAIAGKACRSWLFAKTARARLCLVFN